MLQCFGMKESTPFHSINTKRHLIEKKKRKKRKEALYEVFLQSLAFKH